MTVTTRTTTVHHHYINVEGTEYETTFEADQFIDPKVVIEGDRTEITYAAHDQYAESPRDLYDHDTTMVSLRDGLGYGGRNDLTIDEPDSEVEQAIQAGIELRHLPREAEVFYLVKCGCIYAVHGLDEVEAGECPSPYDALVVGGESDHFEDGSTYALELVDGYEVSLDDFEAVAAMVALWESDPFASYVDLARAYLMHGGDTEVTAIEEWGVQGYSQSDWAEGYIYTTASDFPDPVKAVKAVAEEYAAFFRGDTYLLVREVYIDGEQHEYDVVGGFYGEDHIEDAIKNGGHF